jgi:ABC-type sugar transport system permease subunit
VGRPGASAAGRNRGRPTILSRLHLRRQWVVGWGMILPALAVLLAFLAWPLGYVLFHSLFGFDEAQGTGPFVGLDNFVALADDPTFLHSALVTLLFVGADLALQLAGGLALALFAWAALSDRARGAFVATMLLPAIIAPIVVGLYFRIIYSADYGVLNWLLEGLGLPGVPWTSDPGWALVSVILASAWTGIPMMFLILLGGLLNLPDDVYEAARIDGAGRVQQLVFVTLPMLAPLIAIALVLRFADVFNVFDKIFALTGGGPGIATETIPMRLYHMAFQDLDLGRADALAVIMVAIQFAVGMVFMGVSRADEAR